MSTYAHRGKYDHLADRDLHIHTVFCKHARGDMEEYVLAGMERGLEEIGFLAHAEAGIEDRRVLWLENDDFESYWRQGNELKARYKDRIKISVGLELGLNPRALDELKAIMGRYPWDRIGLSYHQLPDGHGHLNICSRRSIPRIREVDNHQLAVTYYRDLLDHVSVIKPYMLCHLDVARKHLRYSGEDPQIHELIRALLRAMRKEHIKLEVNTAGYDTVGAPYPEPWIIRESVELGIEPVLCSDSHSPDEVGRRFGEAVRYIEDSLEGRFAA